MSLAELFELIEDCLITEQPVPREAVAELLLRMPADERERWLQILRSYVERAERA